MAVQEIENKYYNMENFEVTLVFDDNTRATYYKIPVDIDATGFVDNLSFSLHDAITDGNPLGVATSNTCNLSIMDANNWLLPTNVNSPYFGKMINGVKVLIKKTSDGINWEDYGTFYTYGWSGGYSNGGYKVASINCQDRLNILRSKYIPEIKVYQGVQAGQLIASVFQGLGLSQDEYQIDSRLNFYLPYGVAQGTKVGTFLDNMCQMLFARVIVDRSNIIHVVPALLEMQNYKNITIDRDELGETIATNSSAIDYKTVEVTYLSANSIEQKVIAQKSGISLSQGVNVISDITFKGKVLSIENTQISFKKPENTNPIIGSIAVSGYQDAMQITINMLNAGVEDAQLYVEGKICGTDEVAISSAMNNNDVLGGRTFTFNTNQILSSVDANYLLTELKSYINTISHSLSINNIGFTPDLYLGDTITIVNGLELDGIYKITKLNINLTSGYSCSLGIIKIADLPEEQED
jgi:hypothetical protein